MDRHRTDGLRLHAIKLSHSSRNKGLQPLVTSGNLRVNEALTTMALRLSPVEGARHRLMPKVLP
jgi:hypothetical protein